MESDSDFEEFFGFSNSDIEEENDTEGENSDESDISVSTVNKDDLSDFSVSESEDEEEENVSTWGDSHEEVTVTPFESRSGPVSGVDEDGTAQEFFLLLFPDELIDLIVRETNLHARRCIAVKPDPK